MQAFPQPYDGSSQCEKTKYALDFDLFRGLIFRVRNRDDGTEKGQKGVVRSPVKILKYGIIGFFVDRLPY